MTEIAAGDRESSSAGSPQREGRWVTLVVLCLASFIAVIDTTIVSVALPSISAELGFASSQSQWILNGYALAFGGLLLLFGRAGDLWGRRRLFLAGLVVFAAAALVGGLARTPDVLIVARCLQGVGAAAFVPASLSLLTAAYSAGDQRNRAVGIYGAMAALGFVVGMVGGGVITELFGWRWVMFVNVPIALATLLPARFAVRESRDEQAPRSLDLPGAVTLTTGIALLLYAISELPAAGVDPRTLGLAVVGGALLVLFAVVEHRAATPLVPLTIFRTRRAMAPNLAIFLQSTVGVAWLYALTLYFQEVLGHGPLMAGLLFLPMTAASVVAASVAGRLTTRLGPRRTATLGLVGVIVGLLLMTLLPLPVGLPMVITGTVVGEAGFMLGSVPLTILASTGTGEDSRGLSAGLLNTFSQLGNAWGLGVVAAVTATGVALVDGLQSGLMVCVAFAAAALLMVGFGLPVTKDLRAQSASQET